MKNETQMYLVPGKLTDEQASKAGEAAMRALALGRETCIADYIIHAIGTPIQPCADIPVIATLGTLRDPVPCVRQSDALAKLAEKDAEIARLRDIFGVVRSYITEAPSFIAKRGALDAIEEALKGGAA